MSFKKNENNAVTYCEPMRFNASDKKLTPLLIEGLPWFIGKEVCDILDIANSRDAIGRLDSDEKLVSVLPTSGQKRQVNLVNESGLYSLIFQSRKPEAKAFRKWVTGEVLPSIRRTGSYATPAAMRRRTRGELVNAEVLNLLWLIGESLNRGDQKEIAMQLGVSVQAIHNTLNGYNRSPRILMALYSRARSNREEFMLYHQPALMAQRLTGDADLQPGNHLPAVKLSNKRGGALGNQNARKKGGQA
ncbi:MAG: Bro-N domain-containing protein [Bacteroidales bacterium]|nr:Bro-N domain-containing protein [Bacteroidales bacterium]HOI31209.1 Bro-N domain-containing protein [Bacteroidales bacterium]